MVEPKRAIIPLSITAKIAVLFSVDSILQMGRGSQKLEKCVKETAGLILLYEEGSWKKSSENGAKGPAVMTRKRCIPPLGNSEADKTRFSLIRKAVSISAFFQVGQKLFFSRHRT